MAELLTHKLGRTLLLLGVAGLLLFLLFMARGVLTPFLMAFFLAYLFDPLVTSLERKRVPRTVAIISLLASLLSALVLIGILLFPVLRLQSEVLIYNIPSYIETIREWLVPLIERIYRTDPARLRFILTEVLSRLGDLPVKILQSTTNFLWGAFSNLFNIAIFLLNLLITPVATFYLLKDFSRIKESLFDYCPLPMKESVLAILGEIDDVLSGFLRGQLVVALILALLYSTGLVICQVPLGILLGIVAGMANIIPYLGVIVGLVPSLFLSFLQFGDWQHPLGVVVVFGVAQALEGTLITPRVVGDRLGLHPVAIMVVVLLGAHLLGFLGILLAVPAAAVGNIFLKRARVQYQQSSFFLGSQPVESQVEGRDRMEGRS